MDLNWAGPLIPGFLRQQCIKAEMTAQELVFPPQHTAKGQMCLPEKMVDWLPLFAYILKFYLYGEVNVHFA